MQKVVNQGTGQRVKHVKDIKIYAKTSTAQTSGLDKHDLGNEYLEHGWFVCYFYYKDQPPLTVIILMEHVSTSRVAAEVAKNFLSEYKKMIDQQS
jgi:cell division protein FtsI/penicillin-binding protein 2